MSASNNDNSFHLRGTHLYLMLDDIARTGAAGNILQYVNSLVESCQRVESVFVKGAMSRDARRLPDAVALSIFQALSGLHKIERLEISGDGRFGGLFLPVKAMILVLQNSPRHLLSLRLGNVILTTAHSGMQDMVAFASSIQRLSSLNSIDLVRCRAEAPGVSLEPIVQTIASIQTLQQAMFCETLISSSNTGSYLSELCKSPSLKKIWWKTMPGMSNDHIVATAHQLKRNNVLTELTIRSHGLGEEAGKAIADLLLANDTLQVINLDLDRAEYGLEIAKALHTNTSLTCLDVWAWGGEVEASASCAITETFTTMLQYNHVLRFLTFQGLDWNNPQVDFYLRLNRAGRRQLLKNFDDRAKWVETLTKQKEDVAVVYHFLGLAPNLCYAHSIGDEAGSSKRKRKVDNQTGLVSKHAKLLRE